VAAFVLMLSLSSTARAVEPLPELIPRLLVEGGWLTAHYPGAPGAEQPNREHRSFFKRIPEGGEFVGTNVRISVVARDWHAAYNLTDGRSLLFDRLRMIRSSRMAVARISADGGRFLPYAEVSFGQWRPDTELVPWLRSDIEAAGQVALGFEMRIAERCAFAWGVERTQIYGTVANVPATKIHASFAMMRAEF